MECGKNYLYLKKKCLNQHLFAFVPSRCKSWSCPKCRPGKSRQVKNYIQENFKSENLYMLTLTFFHTGTALQAWENVGKCWNRMRTFITLNKGPFDYLRIVEPHKKGGWPHLHILIKGCVIDSTILDRVCDWGFGWNAHVVRMGGVVASNYLSHYLNKKWPDTDADVLRVSSKCRIVSVNRGMPAIFTKKSDWDVVKFAMPASHSIFMCSAIVNLLKKNKAAYVLSSPFSDGFVIVSDVDLQDSWLEKFSDPYVWKVCEGFEYEYIPYGLQQELSFTLSDSVVS